MKNNPLIIIFKIYIAQNTYVYDLMRIPYWNDVGYRVKRFLNK